MTVDSDDQEDAEVAAGRGRRGARAGSLVAAARSAWPALVGYALVRLVGLIVLSAWAKAKGRDIDLLLGNKFDAGWYMVIAQNGYDHAERLKSNMAFFPLFPGLVSAVATVTPMNQRVAGLVISAVAALAAAWGMYALGAHLYGRRAGVLLAVLWGVLPHAVVQTMAYTEALFTAFAVWSLYALLRGRWLTAGMLCLLAGLTRPTASALIPVVGLAALIAIVKRRDGWRPWAAMFLAPLGWVGYVAWVADRTGRLDGWFHIQGAGWGSSWDGGRDTVRSAREILTNAAPLELYVVTLVLLVAVVLLVLGALDRQPWQLLLFSGLLLATTVGATGYYHAKARFLLPAFALLLPVARALARTTIPKLVVILGCLTLISAYFGGYLLLIWKNSP